jgi:hypothetical protein
MGKTGNKKAGKKQEKQGRGDMGDMGAYWELERNKE